MNLLVVGASHRTAPVNLLEQLAIEPSAIAQTLRTLTASPHIGGAVVLSTCNRVEIYAEVTAFHGGLTDIGGFLAKRAGLSTNEIAQHLYVRYDDEAVRHTFRVASGLDSMVVGESQILGQLRAAYAQAAERNAVGTLLHEVMQHALRASKRVHTETGIDAAGQNVLTAALELGAERFGPIDGRAALVIGAGSMGALALATLRRAGVGRLVIANRSGEPAARLAATYRATIAGLEDLDTLLPTVDVVVTATAATAPVLTAQTLRLVNRPLLVLDLAIPRDVEPIAGELPGVTLIDLAELGEALAARRATADVATAEELITDETESFARWLRGTEVAPTVAALRGRANDVVADELRRLWQRRPDLTTEERAEIGRSIHRVVQRLLHQPTVRMRELAATDGDEGRQYADVLRELFALELTPDAGVKAMEER